MGDYQDMSERLKTLADGAGKQSQADYALRHRRRSVVTPADALAADTHSVVLMRAEKDLRLISVVAFPAADVTAHASNYATIDINKADGAGGALTSIDDLNTASGGDAAFDDAHAANAFTIVTTDTLDEGEVLIAEVTKAASGVALPDMTYEIEYELL